MSQCYIMIVLIYRLFLAEWLWVQEDALLRVFICLFQSIRGYDPLGLHPLATLVIPRRATTMPNEQTPLLIRHPSGSLWKVNAPYLSVGMTTLNGYPPLCPAVLAHICII